MENERFGEFAETLARIIGTGRFIAIQSVVLGAWAAMNFFVWRYRWDPYPFQGLNLVLSTQAAYAAPLILVAQRRQDARDRDQEERDRSVRARTHVDADFIARELASVRMELTATACRQDLDAALAHIDGQIRRLAAR